VLFKLSIITILSVVFIPAITFAESSGDITSLSPEERLTQAVQSLNITIDDNQRAIIAQKCQSAQAILLNTQDKNDKIVRSRIETYTVIQKELLALKLRMARQGVDASEIDLLIGKIQQAIDNFVLASNTYGTTLNDTLSINCIDKPEQFRAGVVLMRAQRVKLLDSATSLKRTAQVADSSTFSQLKKRLTL
jgi:hypothetical protein